MRAFKATLATAVAMALLATSVVAVTAQSEASAEPTASAAAEPISSEEAATSEFVGTNLPNGTYSADITTEDLVAKGASPDFAEGNQGTWTWTFTDGSFLLLHPGDDTEGCSGVYESVDGSLVRMATTVESGCYFRWDVRWAQEPDGIRFQALPTDEASDEPADIAAYFDRVFLLVE